MDYKKNRLNGLKRSMAFILMLAMVITSLGISGWGADQVYAETGNSTPETVAAVENAMTKYYDGSQDKVLDGWEELAAVYSYLEGSSDNAYSFGVDISDYVLPETGTGAGGLFTALMKGDKDKAKDLAESLVSGGSVIFPGYIASDASTILALEAYNRSGGVKKVEYNTKGAIEYLIGAQEEDGGYKGWGGADSYDDAGMVLTVLSLPSLSEYPNIEKERLDLLSWIKLGQSQIGTFPGYSSASTTAYVLDGLIASNADLEGWANAAMGLIDGSLYNANDGWFSSSGMPWDVFATKQATLALVDYNKGTSFFTNLELNKTHYISTTMQLVKGDGSYLEKDVTVTAGAILNDVASKISGNVISGGFNYYENEEDATEVKDKSLILAVADKFENIAYFSYKGSGIGVPMANVPFGGSADFNIKNLELSTGAITSLPGVSIDITGDIFGDVASDLNGNIIITPIDAVTNVKALNLPATTAVLPAKILMNPGGTQTKTVSVRIEGLDDNLAYYTAYDVVGDGSRQLTAGDAVEKVLEAQDIDYINSNGFLTSIGGVANKSDVNDYYAGWMYYINNKDPGIGLWSQIISDGDEILLYYGSFDTKIVSLKSDVSGSAVTLNISNGEIPVSGVSISWGGNNLPVVTDDGGKITLDNVSSGTYAVQISKKDEFGVPLVVRLPSGTAVTITDGGGSFQEGGSGLTETAKKVFLTVKGAGGKVIFPKTGQTYYVGISARDVLDNTPFLVIGKGFGRSYVSSIDGLGELDQGENSGWLFTVNGKAAETIAADSYHLSIGDEVLWYYTTNYIKDPGSSAWSKTEEKTTDLVAKEDGKGSATVEVSKAEMDKLVKDGGSLTAKSSIVNIELDVATLKGLAKQMGKDLEITAKKVDISQRKDISQVMKDEIGDRPVLDLTVMSGSKEISKFDGQVRVSIPYTLKKGEDPNAVVIYLIKDNGDIEIIRNGEFDPLTKEVKFTTSHLSLYGIAHRDLTFNDIHGHWAKEYITYLAARDYITGMSKDSFAPNGTLTRGQFVQLLANLARVDLGKYGSTLPSSINDVKTTDWFAPAVAWALGQGVVTGDVLPDGTTSFYPEKSISRQDIAVMLNRYRDNIDKKAFPETVKEKTFQDNNQISDYAKDSVKALQKTGIIQGKTETTFAPLDQAKRGEAAKMIHGMLKLN